MLAPFWLWRFLITVLHVPATGAHPGCVLDAVLCSHALPAPRGVQLPPSLCVSPSSLFTPAEGDSKMLRRLCWPNRGLLVAPPWQNPPAACAPATGTPAPKVASLPEAGSVRERGRADSWSIRSRDCRLPSHPGPCAPTARVPVGREASQRVTLPAGGGQPHGAAPGCGRATGASGAQGPGQRGGGSRREEPSPRNPLLRQVLSPSLHKISNSLPAAFWGENS